MVSKEGDAIDVVSSWDVFLEVQVARLFQLKIHIGFSAKRDEGGVFVPLLNVRRLQLPYRVSHVVCQASGSRRRQIGLL